MYGNLTYLVHVQQGAARTRSSACPRMAHSSGEGWRDAASHHPYSRVCHPRHARFPRGVAQDGYDVCLACVGRVSVVDVTTKQNLCRGSTYMPKLLPTSLDDAHELFRIADVMTHELMTHMPRLLFQGARASSTLASSVTRMWGGHSFRRRSSCVTSRFCASSTPWSTP